MRRILGKFVTSAWAVIEYEVYTRYSDVIAIYKEYIYRITTSMLNALAYEKRGRILRLYIIYKVLNIAIRSIYVAI